jgi:hypothetical protein
MRRPSWSRGGLHFDTLRVVDGEALARPALLDEPDGDPTGVSGGGCQKSGGCSLPVPALRGLDLGAGGVSHSGGPWQGTVRSATSKNAVVLIQPVRECSGTA